MMKLNSIKFKIGLLYAVVLIVSVVITSRSILSPDLYSSFYREQDEQLRLKAREIQKLLESYIDVMGDDYKYVVYGLKFAIRLEWGHPEQEKVAELQRKWLEKREALAMEQDYIQFANAKGKVIMSSDNMSKEQRLLFAKEIEGLRHRETFRNITLEKENLKEARLISLPFAYKNQNGYVIQVGSLCTPMVHIFREKLLNISLSIFLILLCAGFLGRIMVSRTLKPVVDITRIARNISYENLSARVEVRQADTEMKYLADAFNDMISRLESSFQYIGQFSSHAAHELKTPLAIIKGEAEVALKKERDIEEYKRVIGVSLEEVDRMLRTINDLLLLAKLDYQPQLIKFEFFDLIEFLTEIREQAVVLASQKSISIGFDFPQERISLQANRLHLRRLFFNLIDNAIKFTPQAGRIDILLKRQGKDAIISVADTGAGISPEDLPNIFKRFFSADRTGQGSLSGYGIGLNIAQSIAKIHRGEVSVKSELGKGSTFTVTLPLA